MLVFSIIIHSRTLHSHDVYICSFLWWPTSHGVTHTIIMYYTCVSAWVFRSRDYTQAIKQLKRCTFKRPSIVDNIVQHKYEWPFKKHHLCNSRRALINIRYIFSISPRLECCIFISSPCLIFDTHIKLTLL